MSRRYWNPLFGLVVDELSHTIFVVVLFSMCMCQPNGFCNDTSTKVKFSVKYLSGAHLLWTASSQIKIIINLHCYNSLSPMDFKASLVRIRVAIKGSFSGPLGLHKELGLLGLSVPQLCIFTSAKSTICCILKTQILLISILKIKNTEKLKSVYFLL